MHPLALANTFHTQLQLGLAKLRGGDRKDTSSYRMMTGAVSYSQVRHAACTFALLTWCPTAYVGLTQPGTATQTASWTVQQSIGLLYENFALPMRPASAHGLLQMPAPFSVLSNP